MGTSGPISEISHRNFPVLGGPLHWPAEVVHGGSIELDRLPTLCRRLSPIDESNKIGTKRRTTNVTRMSAIGGGEADMRTVDPSNQSDANDPKPS
jgi:hypothetical protein